MNAATSCEPHLLPWHTSPHATIRRAVAMALRGTESPASIAVLLVLMRDPETWVRDWATTSIGQTASVDGPAIRDALLQRATDPDDSTRAEALHGLARRKDKRAVPFLIAERQTDQEMLYAFADAAREFLESMGRG